jgi:hypothetical protein
LHGIVVSFVVVIVHYEIRWGWLDGVLVTKSGLPWRRLFLWYSRWMLLFGMNSIGL